MLCYRKLQTMVSDGDKLLCRIKRLIQHGIKLEQSTNCGIHTGPSTVVATSHVHAWKKHVCSCEPNVVKLYSPVLGMVEMPTWRRVVFQFNILCRLQLTGWLFIKLVWV